MTQQQSPLTSAATSPLRVLQPVADRLAANAQTDTFLPGQQTDQEPVKIGPTTDRLVYVSEDKYQRLLAEAEFARQMQASFSRLTSAEREILTFISQGMSAKQIGYQRYVAESTVCKHRSNLYKKLGIGKTVEAMWYAQVFDLPLAWPVELLPHWPTD